MNLQKTKILRMLSKGILVLTGLFLLGFLGWTVYRGIKFRPYKVRVTNVTDSAFTVSWVTDSPMPGIVYFGEKNTFLPGPLAWLGKKKAVDDRDFSDAQSECVSKFNKKASKNKDENFTIDASGFNCNDIKVWKYGKYYTHHITVQNLDAEKEYFFRVGDGVLSYSKGKTDGVVYVEREIPEIDSFKQKTLPVITKVEAPNPAYGTSYNIYYRDDGTMGEKKNFDSLIFLKTFKGEEDLPYLSSVTNSSGGWTIDLANVRTADGTLVSMDGASLEFMPQVENARPGAAGESPYETLVFPLRLLGNSLEDTEEVQGISASVLRDLFVKEALAIPIVGGSEITCWNGCNAVTVRNNTCQEMGYNNTKPASCNAPLITCYYCDGSKVAFVKRTSCTGKYSTTAPSCTQTTSLKKCYYCDGDILKTESKTSCTGDYSETIKSCSTFARCQGEMVSGDPVRGGCQNGNNYCYIPRYHKFKDGTRGELCEYVKTTGANCGHIACGDKDLLKIGVKGWTGEGLCNNGGGCECKAGGNASFNSECAEIVKCYFSSNCNVAVSTTQANCDSGKGTTNKSSCVPITNPKKYSCYNISNCYSLGLKTESDCKASQGVINIDECGKSGSQVSCYLNNDCEDVVMINEAACTIRRGTTDKSKCKQTSVGTKVTCYEKSDCTEIPNRTASECTKAGGVTNTSECENKGEVSCYEYSVTSETCVPHYDADYCNRVSANTYKTLKLCNDEGGVECAYIDSKGVCQKIIDKDSCSRVPASERFDSFPLCEEEVEARQQRQCWSVISINTSTGIGSTAECRIAENITRDYKSACPQGYYPTLTKCIDEGLPKNTGVKCYYHASPTDSSCTGSTKIADCYEGNKLKENARLTSSKCLDEIIKGTNTKKITDGRCSESKCLCEDSNGSLQTISDNQCCGQKYTYFLTYNDGTPLRGECHTSDQGIFCTKEECEGKRREVLAVKLCEIGETIGEEFCGIENMMLTNTGQVCVLKSGESQKKLKPLHQIYNNNVINADYTFYPVEDCGGEKLGTSHDSNKFVKNSFAAEPSTSTSGIYFFPESGIYEVVTSDGKRALVQGGEGYDYFLYYDRDGEEGYQSPEDPQKPKEDEDLIVSGASTKITTSKILDTHEIVVKEGINIISFNFLPALDVDEPMTMGDLLRLVNKTSPIISRISSFSSGAWDGGAVYDNETGTAKGLANQVLTFGKGYILVASRTGTLKIPGKSIESAVPLALSSGWNLIGVHGYSTAYTAKTFIESINTIEGLKANNVTWWPTSRGMYQGYQLQNGQEYGQDFPISPINGYFVRIAEFTPKEDTCKSLIWNPSGEMNGECGSNN